MDEKNKDVNHEVMKVYDPELVEALVSDVATMCITLMVGSMMQSETVIKEVLKDFPAQIKGLMKKCAEVSKSVKDVPKSELFL